MVCRRPLTMAQDVGSGRICAFGSVGCSRRAVLLSSRHLGSRAETHSGKISANFVKILSKFQKFSTKLKIHEVPAIPCNFPKFRQNSMKFGVKNARFAEKSEKICKNKPHAAPLRLRSEAPLRGAWEGIGRAAEE